MNAKFHPAILLITALISCLSFLDAQETAKVSSRQQAIDDMQAIAVQFRTYQLICGTLPTESEGISALVLKPEGASDRWKQLLKLIPVDPWGRDYIYKLAPKTRFGFIISSKGVDPESSDDDIHFTE